jgi:hypothetical protein
VSEGLRLVAALAAGVSRYGADARAEKLRLLEGLAGVRIAVPATLLRFHEALCFLRAYPDDAAVAAAAARALNGFEARVARLPAAARARLRDSGIAGTDLDYPFGLPMARWLARRFPGDVEVAWRRYRGGDRMEEALSLLVTPTEGEAFTEGGLGWRRWLRLARGRRPSDLDTLLRLFDGARLPDAARDWLFESLELPIAWRLRGDVPSRTRLRLDGAPAVHHGDGLRRSGIDLAAELALPLPPPRTADRPLALALIDAARASMATRARELHAFGTPNAADVLVADPGHGLRVALIGLVPDDRLPLDAYYAYLALKNGVPVSYGGGWGAFGRLEFALNIFESFRQGESALIVSQVLRVYRRVFGARAIVVDRSQIDASNPEALRTGSFYFYAKLGFRSADPELCALAERERARIAREPGYRSPLATLRRLGRANLELVLDGATAASPVTGAALAALVTREIARAFDGDRAAATAAAAARVARVLGTPGWRRWPAPERRAFSRMATIVALIPDLARWPAAARARLAAIMCAKGAPSERRYVALLDGHRRLRASLERLSRAAAAP